MELKELFKNSDSDVVRTLAMNGLGSLYAEEIIERANEKVEVDKNLSVDLLITDPTNEEKLGKFTKNYYLDAHGAIIVYDLSNEQSFQKVKYWMEELNSNAPRDTIFCILGNKSDLTADRVVKYEDVKALAGDNLNYEVSAKSGNNVNLAFEQLT